MGARLDAHGSVLRDPECAVREVARLFETEDDPPEQRELLGAGQVGLRDQDDPRMDLPRAGERLESRGRPTLG